MGKTRFYLPLSNKHSIDTTDQHNASVAARIHMYVVQKLMRPIKINWQDYQNNQIRNGVATLLI